MIHCGLYNLQKKCSLLFLWLCQPSLLGRFFLGIGGVIFVFFFFFLLLSPCSDAGIRYRDRRWFIFTILYAGQDWLGLFGGSSNILPLLGSTPKSPRLLNSNISPQPSIVFFKTNHWTTKLKREDSSSYIHEWFKLLLLANENTSCTSTRPAVYRKLIWMILGEVELVSKGWKRASLQNDCAGHVHRVFKSMTFLLPLRCLSPQSLGFSVLSECIILAGLDLQQPLNKHRVCWY